MTAPKPASLNFDALPISATDTLTPDGTGYGTLQFKLQGMAGYPAVGIASMSGESDNHYARFTFSQSLPDSGFAFSAQDGSSFGIKSMILLSLTDESNKAAKITGFDAQGGVIASDIFNYGVSDQSGSVTFNVDTGVLTFGDAWKNVSSVSLVKSVPDTFILGLDDIVLDIKGGLKLAAKSDSGVLGDKITNDRAPVLEGTAEASSELEVFVDDGSSAIATVKSDADGKYTLDTLEFDKDGEHSVTVRMAGSDDAGTTFTFTLDTKADAPRELELDHTFLIGDAAAAITSDFTPSISGRAEKDATVTLYDGERKVGEAVADSKGWQITTLELDDGEYSLTAKQVDVAGNESTASAPITFTVQSGRPSTPVMAAQSDSGIKGDGITNDIRPVFSGTAAPNATVSLFDSTGKLVGIGESNDDGNWVVAIGDGMPFGSEEEHVSLSHGSHKIHAEVMQHVDGNDPLVLKSGIVKVNIDTVKPDTLNPPKLDKASDSGVAGDNITNVAAPTLSGHGADKHARIELYADGKMVGITEANDEGVWSVKADTLAVGKHTLTVAQFDVAGNASSVSEALDLTIERTVRPTPTPSPDPAPTLVDGVAVTVKPVVLPGGATGRAIEVPIITTGRADQNGNATADIPLISSGGKPLLTAQLGVGFGLNASGGPVSGQDAVLKTLIASIDAAAKSNGMSDIAKLAFASQNYTNSLAIAQSLLVETITFKGGAQAGGTIDLVGIGGGQQIATVIDTVQLQPGSSIQLNNVDFAAILGAVNVHGGATSMIFGGDNAAQGFTVGANGSKVFAGGGADNLTVDFNIATAAAVRAATVSGTAAVAGEQVTTTLLHGGTGTDTASFAGAATDYTVEQHGGYVLVSSKTVPGQVAKAVNVEALSFGDELVTLELGAELTTLAGLYQDVLGRQADADGFAYWAGREQAGLSLGGIALELLTSSEGVARFGALDGDAAHDVGLLYRAVFDRAADAGGLAFWTGHMENGMTLQAVADELLQSAEIVGHRLDAASWDFTV